MATKTFRWVGPVTDPYWSRSNSYIGTKSATDLVDYLEKNKEDKAHVVISSNGGQAFIATRIIDMVSQYRARITAEINGLAASAGSIIAIGIANELYSRKSSTMMIHGPSGFAYGNKRRFRQEIVEMEKIEDIITGIYMEKSKLTKKDLEEAYDGELWLTSKEMKEKNIISRILQDNEQVAKIVEESIPVSNSDDPNATIFKLMQMPMDRIAAILETTPTRITEGNLDEELKKKLEAEIEALKEQVVGLKKSNTDLEIKLKNKNKELKKQGNESIVDKAIDNKCIDKEDRSKWLTRLENGGDSVKEILEDMKPSTMFDELGSSKDKKAELKDIPEDVLKDYRAAKFTDSEIEAAWNDEVRPSDTKDKDNNS